LLNWNTARPNAHYWAFSLINQHFAPGNKLVETKSSSADLLAQASITASSRKILLVNTSDQTISVNIDDSAQHPHWTLDVVDESSGEKPPRTEHLTDSRITLAPFAIAVVTMSGK
jgi:hypothetical protein